MSEEKKKKKRFRYISRKTPKGTYRRILIGKRVLVGLNNHEFKGERTKHIHIGDKKLKIVIKPKKLRGIWKYDEEKGKYIKFREKRKKEGKGKRTKENRGNR